MYIRSRKKRFGTYLHQFLQDPDLWPDRLLEWLGRDGDGSDYPDVLTILDLIDFLAYVSGIPLRQDYYVRLLGNWSRWGHNPDRGGDSAALIIALSMGEVVYLEGIVYNRPQDLVNWLLGTDLI